MLLYIIAENYWLLFISYYLDIWFQLFSEIFETLYIQYLINILKKLIIGRFKTFILSVKKVIV